MSVCVCVCVYLHSFNPQRNPTRYFNPHFISEKNWDIENLSNLHKTKELKVLEPDWYWHIYTNMYKIEN